MPEKITKPTVSLAHPTSIGGDGKAQGSVLAFPYIHIMIGPPPTTSHPYVQRIGIDISYGESERYYEDLAREAHIDQLEANIMKLNKQMSQVLNEADFMKVS